MLADVKERWVKALRSGEFKQGIDELHNIHLNNYCCLGVLCKIENIPEKEDGLFVFGDYDNDVQLSSEYLNKIQLTCEEQSKLIILNDHDKKSFEQIADYIEQNF